MNRSLRLSGWLLGAALTTLAGCGALPSGRNGASLSAEQHRLAELFKGTPVMFELQADGSLRSTVPLKFAFDPGHAAVKPPLAAVLDRLALSQREQRSRFSVSAPADGARNGQLGQERAASARDYLVAKGVAVGRFASVAGSKRDNVEVVIAP